MSDRCDATSSLVAGGLARAAVPQSVICYKARAEHIQLFSNKRLGADEDDSDGDARREMVKHSGFGCLK